MILSSLKSLDPLIVLPRVMSSVGSIFVSRAGRRRDGLRPAC